MVALFARLVGSVCVIHRIYMAHWRMYGTPVSTAGGDIPRLTILWRDIRISIAIV